MVVLEPPYCFSPMQLAMLKHILYALLGFNTDTVWNRLFFALCVFQIFVVVGNLALIYGRGVIEIRNKRQRPARWVWRSGCATPQGDEADATGR